MFSYTLVCTIILAWMYKCFFSAADRDCLWLRLAGLRHNFKSNINYNPGVSLLLSGRIIIQFGGRWPEVVVVDGKLRQTPSWQIGQKSKGNLEISPTFHILKRLDTEEKEEIRKISFIWPAWPNGLIYKILVANFFRLSLSKAYASSELLQLPCSNDRPGKSSVQQKRGNGELIRKVFVCAIIGQILSDPPAPALGMDANLRSELWWYQSWPLNSDFLADKVILWYSQFYIWDSRHWLLGAVHNLCQPILGVSRPHQ